MSFSAGDSNQLVVPNHIQQPVLLSAETISTLLQCRQFATLREHRERICTIRGLLPEQAEEIDQSLRQCILHGLLVAKQDILITETTSEAERSEAGKITSIGIPTRDRPGRLEASVTSYARNVADHAQPVTITVMEDSAAPDARARSQQMLRKVRKRYGIEILYAGYEEKRKYADKLIDALDGGRGEVEFALFGDPVCSYRPGANRNALLLETAGDLYLSFDDDSACSFYTGDQSGNDTALVLAGDSDPTKIQYLTDRSEVYSRLDDSQDDIVAMHEVYLGKSLASVIQCARNYGQVQCNEMCAHLLKSLLAKKGAIMASFNGLIGDCGMNSRIPAMSLIKRKMHTAAQLQCAATCREMVRSAAKPTIWHGPGWMNFASGLDNRKLLPPFMPVERSEDTVFIGLLQLVYRDGYFAHLPHALLHDSEPRTGYSNQGLHRPKLYDVILACLHGSLVATVPLSNSSDAMRSLGRQLIEVGSLDCSAFQEWITVVLLRNASRTLRECDKLLQETHLPLEVAGLLRHDYQQSLDNILDTDFAVPVEFASFGRDQARQLTQSILLQFGRLLVLWPDIVTAARSLKNSGERLAHGV